MVLQSTFGKIALTAATGFLTAATAAGAASAMPSDGPYWGKVIAHNGLNVRSGPSTHYRVVGSLHDGQVVGIKCKVNGQNVGGNPRWYKLSDGRYIGGFSAARYIKNLGPAPEFCHDMHKGPYKGKVIARTGLNVRTGPSTHYRVVDTLPSGAVVGIKCKVNGQNVGGNPRWYKLNDGRYVDGFSAARYIANIGPAPKYCHR
jgi:uncharacterized protein YraI